MKLLIKFPTRGRPQKSLETLKKYISLAEDMPNIKIIVSIDEDDKSVNESMFKIDSHIEVFRGPSLGKIGAINRDMPDVSTFDIVLLASDDMIPVVKGYDNIIRSKMREHFPDTDGVLFFNDGHNQYKLNTLIICGRKYYSRFGYLYYPEYKSLWCDNEFMEVANRLGRQVYFNQVIIEHNHWYYNKSLKDELYAINQQYLDIDYNVYMKRKITKYDLSILICTIPRRLNMFINLLNRLTLLKQSTTLSIQILFDNDEYTPIGKKRNDLLDKAVGKYCAFVDDDDNVTDDYFKVIEESELKYDCIVLNGMRYVNGVKDKGFYHSLKYSSWHEDSNGYYRSPNHLNPVLSSIAKTIRFSEVNFGEDHDYSKRLFNSKLIKTEYTHDKLQYIYLYVSNKTMLNEINMSAKKLIKNIFNIK